MRVLNNKYINNRRMSMGVKVKEICDIMGWKSTETWYNRVSEKHIVWEIDDLVKVLNLLNCSFEQLYGRNENFEPKHKYTYVAVKNLSARISQLKVQFGISNDVMYAAFGGRTRQNYNSKTRKRRMSINQIENVLDLFKLPFHEVFADRLYTKNAKSPRGRELSDT